MIRGENIFSKTLPVANATLRPDMSSDGFTIFATTIGPSGIVWSDVGVLGVQLPEGRKDETRARVRQRFPDARPRAPSPQIARAVDAIVRLLRGEAADLSAIELDMSRVSPFHRRVYQAARAIPRGRTLSYGELARRLGAPRSARAVGQALGRNPFAIVVPCHRVISASGRAGGFSAHGGVATKLRMLSIECAALPEARVAPSIGRRPPANESRCCRPRR